MSTDTTIEEQRALWGTNPRDWAELAEPQNRPLFEELLDATAVTNATRLLDVACGSGYAVALAADRGAHVSGIDITPALLEIARERSPGADLREGEMGALPFADSQFDVVTATNAFQFALDPEQALHDATRVLVPGGRIAAATFAEPERNEGTAIHLAMKALLGNDSDDHHQPYSLSTPSGLRDALTNAGVHHPQRAPLRDRCQTMTQAAVHVGYFVGRHPRSTTRSVTPPAANALRAFAEVLRSHSRAQDTVCRTGGEEFSVVFRDTTDDDAGRIANPRAGQQRGRDRLICDAV